MEQLPDEMLLHIMSFLAPQELLDSVARVCGRWQDLALNVALWSRCGAYCYHTPGSAQLSRAGRAAGPAAGPPERALALQGREDAARLLEAWRGCCTLQRLDMDTCRLTADALRGLLRDFSGLRALGLRGCGRADGGLDYRPLAGFPHLVSLCLSRCKDIPEGTVGAVAAGCGRLQDLRADWASCVSDGDVRQLVERLGPQLRVLSLGGELLTDGAYLQLAACSQLQQLGVAPCGALSDRGLLAGLAALPRLRALQLTDGGGLSTDGLISFFGCLAAAGQLRTVALAWCPGVNDDVLELLAHGNPELRHASVRHSQRVTDRGVAALLRACPLLESLSLVWNDRLGGAGFLPLLQEGAAPRLRHLDLGYCDSIAPEAVNALVAARRGMKVVRPEVWCRPRKSAHACCEDWALVS